MVFSYGIYLLQKMLYCQNSKNARSTPMLMKSIKFKAIHLQSKEAAQNAPTPITTYTLFLDGRYITNEQMNEKRFLKLLEK